MGIIRAVSNAVSGTLSDQWLEVIHAKPMESDTIVTTGQWKCKNGYNKSTNFTEGVITNGSVIHVDENQCMLLVDGGKVIDYTAEAGYYFVNLDTAPSMMNGQFGEVLEDAFDRIKFGGTSPVNMQVYFINLQEIKNIPFGTSSPINYFDEFYNAELFLRIHGYYSIRVVNPLLFYSEMVVKNKHDLTIESLKSICLSEFLGGLQTAIGQLSIQGERISHLNAKNTLLADIMADMLDDNWSKRRGMVVDAVGISSISYDDISKEIINIRNKGAILTDTNIRDAYTQGAVARGIESAGSNPAGATNAMLGVTLGKTQADTFSSAPVTTPSPATWGCPQCTNKATGNFCNQCGIPRPKTTICPNCHFEMEANSKFCFNCGSKFN